MQSLGRSLKIEALVLFCQCHLEACMCGPNRQWGCCLLRRARCGCIGKAEAQQHATMSISFWGPSGRKRARWTLTSQTWKSLCSNEMQLRSARDTAQDSFTIANLHFLQHISDAPCDRISLRALVLTGAVNRRRGLGRASEEAVSADYDPGSSTAHPAAGIRDQHCGLLQL